MRRPSQWLSSAAETSDDSMLALELNRSSAALAPMTDDDDDDDDDSTQRSLNWDAFKTCGLAR